MKALIKLFFRKKWGSLRHLFSKPLSAIVTLLIIGFFGLGLAPLFTGGERVPLEMESFVLMEWLLIGMLVMFCCSMFLSKHKALFFLQDSYFLFTGPFSPRQILRYLLLEIGFSALLVGGISSLTAIFVGMSFQTPNLLPLHMIAAALLVGYALGALLDAIYLRGLIKEKSGKGFWIVIIALGALVLALFGVSLLSRGFDMQAAASSFIEGSLFYAVPIFGWVKLVLDSAYSGNALGILAGYGLLLLSCILPSLVLVRTKGYFYEQAMVDAENFTEYYQKARQGKADDVTRPVRETKSRFLGGGWALFSKNLLIAKKQSFVRMQDLAIVVIYLIMAVFLNFGFIGLCAMLFFWLMIAVGSSSLVEDLKHHYAYLIPAHPLVKLLAILLIPALKTGLIMAAAVLIGAVLLSEPILHALFVIPIGLTFILLMQAGTLVSLRIMKSRNNLMVEQILRMVFSLAGAAPGLGVIVWAAGRTDISMTLLFGILMVFNLLISAGILWACSPMMNGRELAPD